MKSMKPKIIKAVSILLALLSVIGATVSAEVLNPIASQGGSEPVIVEEDIALRGTYEKHFIMSDGSSMAVAYNEPVHYEEDGQWFEIDNTLVETKGGGRIANVKGLENVSFSQEPSQELVVIEKDGYTISWGLRFSTAPNAGLSASGRGLNGVETRELDPKVTARVEEPDCTGFEGTDQLMLARNAAQLTYENAAGEGVDVEYTVLPGRVKEAIILESPQDIVSYIMDITAEGLTASINEDGEVVFSDGTEVIFTIWAPYMYDSADELSEEIELDLADNGNGSYTVTLTPDAEWLNDEARVYPITIDPDVTAGQSQTNGIDNFVMEGSGVQSNTLDRLYMGLKSGKLTRSYQKFKEMPTIPSGATITSANQTFYVTSGTSTGNNISAYKVGSDWSSGTLTWANKPSGTSIQTNISHNGLTQYNINMLNTVKGWYTNSTSGKNGNYGIMLRYYNESINDFNTVYSADYATTSKRPTLRISYNSSEPSSRPAQRLEYNAVYFIKNKNSGKYLDISGGSAYNGANVIQYNLNGGNNQKWKIVNAGNGECKIVSMSSPSGTQYVLNVETNSSNNGVNINVYKDANVANRRFKIGMNTDFFSYRIMSKCSEYRKVVTVEGASCSDSANVIQYQYNVSNNDEWIFERVSGDMVMGSNYAHRNYDKYVITYPNVTGLQSSNNSGDCTNFVSQCMLASGIHFRGEWFIYKKNNTYLAPANATQLDYSWETETYNGIPGVGPSSPWISARQFNAFWDDRVSFSDYTPQYIVEHQQEVFGGNDFVVGDVVQWLYNTPAKMARHSYYVCCLGTYKGKPDLKVSYHSNNVYDASLTQICESLANDGGDHLIRIFRMK